jgi:hypothetical protein
MTASTEAKWSAAESSLTEEQRRLLRKLKNDYVAASRLHAPRYTGGPNPGILSELIRMGWQKSS